MCLFTNQENRDQHHDNNGIGDDNVDYYNDYGSDGPMTTGPVVRKIEMIPRIIKMIMAIAELILDQKSLDAMYQHESDKTAQVQNLKVYHQFSKLNVRRELYLLIVVGNTIFVRSPTPYHNIRGIKANIHSSL